MGSAFRVEGLLLRFRIFEVKGQGLRVPGLEFRALYSGFGVWDVGFRG